VTVKAPGIDEYVFAGDPLIADANRHRVHVLPLTQAPDVRWRGTRDVFLRRRTDEVDL
jgi:hypothetical protein